MKNLVFGILPIACFLVACENFNRPLNSSGTYDPLRVPGSGGNAPDASHSPSIYPGQFVTANIPNTAFYKNKPKGSEDADKLLSIGTNMKIISNDRSYVKVELDNGEVGWVPAVMVTLPGTNPAPVPDTDSLEAPPLSDPGDQPPGGAIPTIMDPDAPRDADSLPPAAPRIP